MRKIIVLSILFFSLSGFAVILFTHSAETNPYQEIIDKLNEEIAAAGLRWQAGITSLTGLDPASRHKRLGRLRPFIECETENLYEFEPQAVPSSLDWRNKDGKNWLTPVKDQGDCGSCYIFGVIAAAEAVYKVEKMTTDIFPDFSEQHILSCSNTGDCENGGYEEDVLNYLKSTGVPPEYCFPYKAKDLSCSPCQNWINRKATIKSWKNVTNSNEDRTAIFNALQKGPVIGWLEVYSDFDNYKSGIYEKTPGASYDGDHLISIVGYNKAQGYWICKNSYGTGWGEDGYFRIAFGQVEIGTYIKMLSGVSIRDKMPVFDPIGNKTINEGENLSFKVTATDTDHDPLEYSNPQLPTGASFNRDSGQFDWTPAYDQSGQYQITFTVCDTILKAATTIMITVNDANRKIGKGKF